MMDTKLDIRKGLGNQAVGITPLLLLMLLNNFYNYEISFIISIIFFGLSILLFRRLFRGHIYQFMLLPTAATFILYFSFVFLKLDSILHRYSPLIVEWLLVVILTISSFFKSSIIKRIRKSAQPALKRPQMHITLIEFFFVAQIVQNIYTLHLFSLLFFKILPVNYQSAVIERFLFRDLALILGVGIIIYEQIRLTMMKNQLKREVWLPVLDQQGKVIGRIAKSVSNVLQSKQYRYPIIRVIVVYNGMIYLSHRDEKELVSPGLLDTPFTTFLLFQEKTDDAIKRLLGTKKYKKIRQLINYSFDNNNANRSVFLYVLKTKTEAELKQWNISGKLWTAKQIEENIGRNIFSEYFEREYPYLKRTVLLAAKYLPDESGIAEAETPNVVPTQSLPNH